MSAYVVSSTHIATCAKIIKETVFKYDQNPPSNEEIRDNLALANVASVAWRYGEEGQKAYAPLLGMIVGQLKEKGYSDEQIIQAPSGTNDIDKACFVDGYTWIQYLSDCQAAQPIKYNDAEAYMYLSCLDYQSCEPPEWKESKARGWIEEAKDSLAHSMAEKVLDGQHVWEVPEEKPFTLTA